MTIITPTLNLVAKSFRDAANGIPPGMTFTRALSTATRVNELGLIETVPADVFRHQYDPATKEYLGWLTEGARTNLFPYSDEFDNAAWGKSTPDITINANAAVSPDGTTNADRINDVGTDGASDVFNEAVTVPNDSNPHTASMYFKKDTASIIGITLNYTGGVNLFGNAVVVNLDDGDSLLSPGAYSDPDSYNVVDAGNGWWRVDITASNNTDGNTVCQCQVYPVWAATFTATLDRTFTGAVFVWGAQLEAGAFPSSYIPTTGVATLRNLDFPLITDLSWFNELIGTYLMDGVLIDYTPTVTDRIIAMSDAAISVTQDYYWLSGPAVNANFYITPNSNVVSTGNFTPGTDFSFAVAYSVDDIAAVRDGGTPATDSDTLGILPSEIDKLVLGNSTNAARPMFGTIKRVQYWPTRLTNEELIELTADRG
jgi:hypothetical protein